VTSSWFFLSTLSLLISYSANGVPESSWRVLLLMYRGALNFLLYSLYEFRVGRLGTAPELHTVRPYGLKESFIHKQLDVSDKSCRKNQNIFYVQ